MINKDVKPPKNIRFYDILDLQPGYTNPGSSEGDLMSGKMKEAVIYIYTIIVVQLR